MSRSNRRSRYDGIRDGRWLSTGALMAFLLSPQVDRFVKVAACVATVPVAAVMLPFLIVSAFGVGCVVGLVELYLGVHRIAARTGAPREAVKTVVSDDHPGARRVVPVPETQSLDLIVPSLIWRDVHGDHVDDPDDLVIFGIEHETLAELWLVCPRVDWMLWLVRRAVSVDLIPGAAGEQLLAQASAMGLAATPAAMRRAFGNPFAALDNRRLLERRHQVSFWLFEGNGPLTPRLVTILK